MPLVGSNTSLFEIRDEQAWAGQVVLNRYYYLVPPTVVFTPSWSSVAAAFDDLILQNLVALQDNSLFHQQLVVTQINAIDNFGVYVPTNDQGLLVESQMPNYTSVGIQLTRSTRETRSGRKRFGGLTEEQVDGNVLTSSAQTNWDTFAGLLADTLVVPVGDDPEPVIIGNIYDTDTGELLPVQAWTYNFLAGAVVQQFLTTQNSRKIGRGS